MDRVIQDMESQIEFLENRSYTARTLKEAADSLARSQEWYEKSLAARLEEEHLMAEYQLALEILKRKVRNNAS